MASMRATPASPSHKGPWITEVEAKRLATPASSSRSSDCSFWQAGFSLFDEASSGSAAHRPAEQRPASSGGDADSKDGNLEMAGTNPPGHGRAGLPQYEPSPDPPAGKRGQSRPEPHSA